MSAVNSLVMEVPMSPYNTDNRNVTTCPECGVTVELGESWIVHRGICDAFSIGLL
jgi:hypothetical protein